MSILVTTRAELLREFYHLTGGSAADSGMQEHDSVARDHAHNCCQQGLWRAQAWLIKQGQGDRWLKTSAALTLAGSDDTGGRYAVLPTDFLKLASDEESSALHEADGTLWGTLVSQEADLKRRYGNYVALRQGAENAAARLWFARGATVPTALYVDYYAKHAELAADGTTLDFPEEWTPLAVAEAAAFAVTRGWVPADRKADIKDELQRQRTEIPSLFPRHGQPPRLQGMPAYLGKYFACLLALSLQAKLLMET